ncbi:MAG: hypothetical protein JJT82_03940 [Legionellaceae bacterium]|nr:hypothetical protein [Legionellaceae bacterium]
MGKQAEPAARLIDIIDDDMRNNINGLHQKLGELKADIDEKLRNSMPEASCEDKNRASLQKLGREVECTLANLAKLMNVSIQEDMDAAIFLAMNRQSIAELANILESNLEHIINIKHKIDHSPGG